MSVTVTAPSRRILRFRDLSLADAGEVGQKGANLGELTRAGLPVPPGFVVSTSAFLETLERAGVRDRVRRLVEDLDLGDPAAIEAAGARASRLVQALEPPEELRREVLGALTLLGTDGGMAVRSSPTFPDAEGVSFAGMTRTFTNVPTDEEVLDRLVACWASLYTPLVLTHRIACRVPGEPTIAVVVQHMVDTDRSGALFTIDPTTGERDRIVVEAARGLGATAVDDGAPDTYVVERASGRLVLHRTGRQSDKLVRGSDGRDRRVPLTEGERRTSPLAATEILELASLAERVERHYGGPQDLAWGFARNQPYLLQSRPITASGHARAGARHGELLVAGLGAAPGIAGGPVHVVHDLGEGAELRAGEVLVAAVTGPAWGPVVRRAAAVVTDGGGMGGRAAVLSRELGVPCVVATRQATSVLRDGEPVMVNGTDGTVIAPVAPAVPTVSVGTATDVPVGPAVVVPSEETIGTRLLAEVATPAEGDRAASSRVDGASLRSGRVVAAALGGVHPATVLERGGRAALVASLVQAVGDVARAFAPRPVRYWAADLTTTDLRSLDGGEREPHERNPRLGYRGALRAVREPALFGVELEVLAQVRERHPNVHLVIPFVRTAGELEACLGQIDASPLGGDRELERWLSAAVPSATHRIPSYAALGIDGVVIDADELAPLVLGLDPSSTACAALFDPRDAAVLDAIARIARAGRSSGLATSLSGRVPADQPDVAEQLVRTGTGSIAVAPELVDATRRALAAAERRLLLDAAIGPVTVDPTPDRDDAAGRTTPRRAVASRATIADGPRR